MKQEHKDNIIEDAKKVLLDEQGNPKTESSVRDMIKATEDYLSTMQDNKEMYDTLVSKFKGEFTFTKPEFSFMNDKDYLDMIRSRKLKELDKELEKTNFEIESKKLRLDVYNKQLTKLQRNGGK